MEKKIVIVGGGFGGIRCALDLARQKNPNIKIQLISDKTHFEYHAALYRVVTGKSPLEVCIPLREIFDGTRVEVCEDTVTEVNLREKYVRAQSHIRYPFDYLVLALGSETEYYGIPGLRTRSFGFKSITEAIALKRHLHEVFSSCEAANKEQKECAAHIVVVGGGASGVELAGELAQYGRSLALKHGLDPKMVKIDLIEAASRLLPSMRSNVSVIAKQRLEALGVNVLCDKHVVKEDIDNLYLQDMSVKTKTVVWTAGASSHHLYASIQGIRRDAKGRVEVDERMQMKDEENIFVIGDAAATRFSGMAQTALHDGRFAAYVIRERLVGRKPHSIVPMPPQYAIPIGPGWALALVGPLRFTGYVGWLLRRVADLRFFLSILSPAKALAAFRSGQSLCESCKICEPRAFDRGVSN